MPSGMVAPAHTMERTSAPTPSQYSPGQNSAAASAVMLFDPTQPTQPHPGLLPSLINIYYENVHPIMPIISSECVIGKYLMSSLSPVLANAMAALAVPYVQFCWGEVMLMHHRYAVTMPQFAGANLQQVSLEYLSMSKVGCHSVLPIQVD
jgi:hypothetical protein